MKLNTRYVLISFLLLIADQASAQRSEREYVVFFETPLACSAVESLGCGSRAKPLLLDLEASEFVSEAWLDRTGSYVGISLAEPYLPMRQFLTKAKLLFDKHEITFKPVQSPEQHRTLRGEFRTSGRWYRAGAVDSLSWEEAAVLAGIALSYLEGFDALPRDSAAILSAEVRHVIGLSLTGKSESDHSALHQKIMQIATKYVGEEAVRRSMDRYSREHQH